MIRLWGKIVKKNKIINSFVYECPSDEVSLALIKQSLEEICYHFNLSIPMWLDDNDIDMLKFFRTRFYSSHFIEEISFDYLEIEIIEDDKKK